MIYLLAADNQWVDKASIKMVKVGLWLLCLLGYLRAVLDKCLDYLAYRLDFFFSRSIIQRKQNVNFSEVMIFIWCIDLSAALIIETAFCFLP